MKIEKLNENKIRITLNIDDLAERDIDLHSFMSSSIESQDIFFDMLNEAEKKVGFDTNDCKLMIEALALQEGLFVLTITKFEHKPEEKSPITKKKIHIKRKSPTINLDKTIYSFDSFDEFCEFCTLTRKLFSDEQIYNFSETSDLYEYNSNYYLIFSKINIDSVILKKFCTVITEFAHFVNSSELFERKIKEYRKNNNSFLCNYNL